ncbi:MAG: helix-turn-helix domain-containing protein [Actinobacteria bacterium]|nr:helix-turn-helix domain-containing protein [Actinomycetota bacterium]
MQNNLERLIGVEELSKLLGVQECYVYSLTHRKKIPFIKLGKYLRFRPSEVTAFLEAQKEGPDIATKDVVIDVYR